jgi:hypothetical protein
MGGTDHIIEVEMWHNMTSHKRGDVKYLTIILREAN